MALLLALLMLLVACADGAGETTDDTDDTDDAADGATQDDGVGSDVTIDEEVTLTVASIFPPEHWQSRPWQQFGDAVEESTDGQVSFEYHWAGSLVPAPEMGSGLADGIIDMAFPIYVYTPADFPIDSWITDLGFVGDDRPVAGHLQGFAATLEWGFQSEQFLDEIARNGLEPLLPRFRLQPAYDLLCREEPVTNLEEAQGKRVRTGGPTWEVAAEALGMTPVSMVPGEIYEGMERGVLDCFMGPVVDVAALGLWDVANQYTSVGFAGFSSYGVASGETTWNSLSPEVQQVIWDHLPVYIEGMVRGYLEEAHRVYSEGPDEHGLEFHQLDSEAEAAVEEYRDGVLASMAERAPEGVEDPQAMVDSYLELHDEWFGIVEDLGYLPEQATWDAWAAAQSEGVDIDLEPYVDAVVERILAPNRPGS